MTYEELLKTLFSSAISGITHADYDRVVQVAKDCRTWVTHQGINEKLRTYKPRENKAALEQRIRITQHIIKPIVSSLRRPFYKVARNDKVLLKLGLKDDKQKERVSTLAAGFFGRNKGSKKGKSGLDRYLRTRFVQLSFIDPNAWIIAEWGAFAPDTLPKVQPFEAYADEVVNFWLQDGELEALLVRKPVVYFTGANKAGAANAPTGKGYKFMIYGAEDTVVISQVDKLWIETNPETVPADAEVVTLSNDKTYIMQRFNHKLGFVPAFRVGHEMDDETNGRTCIAPYYAAEPYFMKLVQAVSEMDLTMALHIFPQKLAYVQKCTGPSREEPCMNGKSIDGSTCSACNGSGIRFHKSAQDAIILPMPKPGEEPPVKLSEMLEYKGPPIETLTTQKEIINDYKIDCHTAVFNTTSFVVTTFAKTATEKEQDADAANDTLFPFANKISELTEDILSVFVRIAGGDLATVDIRHTFPGDLKLKTVSQLLDDLKKISESQAPSFVRDIVNRDLAEKLFGGDVDEMVKYDTKRRFFPFNGKTENEIMTLLSMDFVPRFNKVLYGSFELIFAEIEKDNRDFYVKTFDLQWEIVGKKVNAIMDALDKAAADRFQMGSLTTDAPGKQPGDTQQQGEDAGNNSTGGNNSPVPDTTKTPV